MDLVVQSWPIDRLVEYARNPRKNDDQVDRMAAAIAEFGFRIPIVAKSDGMVIDGHLRLKAARKLGLAEVPVALADELTDAQIKAFRLLANKSANWAAWDDDMLRIELDELKDLGFDMDLTGFDAGELGVIFADKTAGMTDPDEVPPAPKQPVSRLGDVWLLGRHRLACGDSTSAESVDAVLNGATPHLMVTDPPYGVEYDAAWRNDALAGKPRADGKLGGGARAVGVVMNDGQSDWRAAWALFPGDVAYVWHAGRHASSVQESLEAAMFEIRCQIIWVKQQFAIGRGHYHWMHEPLWYAVRKGATAHWAGDRKQMTIWEIDKPQKSETGHSTQKPVECMRRPMENNSKPGDAVYDPFVGSGTTLIAAEMTGRVCHGIELNPVYIDVAVKRWEAFTGQTAKLESSGETIAELATTRLAAMIDA